MFFLLLSPCHPEKVSLPDPHLSNHKKIKKHTKKKRTSNLRIKADTWSSSQGKNPRYDKIWFHHFCLPLSLFPWFMLQIIHIHLAWLFPPLPFIKVISSPKKKNLHSSIIYLWKMLCHLCLNFELYFHLKIYKLWLYYKKLLLCGLW